MRNLYVALNIMLYFNIKFDKEMMWLCFIHFMYVLTISG
jgi:hypothetical protein